MFRITYSLLHVRLHTCYARGLERRSNRYLAPALTALPRARMARR